MNIPRLQMYLNFLSKLSAAKAYNYGLLSLSYHISSISGRVISWGHPAFLSVEPTNACNLRCPECPTGARTSKAPKGFIGIETLDPLLGDVERHITHVNLFFQGEPFLHPELAGIIGQLSKRTFVTVSTNGHFIDDEMAGKIVRSGLQRIIISLDGHDQESYAVYRQGGDFSAVTQGIKALSEARGRSGRRTPFIEVQCLLFKHTESRQEEIAALSRKLGADTLTFKTAQFYNADRASVLLPSGKNSRYSLHDGKLVLKSKLPNKCWRSWSGLVVTWDGLVLPCCFDKDRKHGLGPLGSEAISGIWHGEKRRAFAASILRDRGGILMCKNCSEGLRLWKMKYFRGEMNDARSSAHEQD